MLSCQDGGDGPHLTRLAGAFIPVLAVELRGSTIPITTSAQRREHGLIATLMSIKQTAPATVSLPDGEEAGAPFPDVWGVAQMGPAVIS